MKLDAYLVSEATDQPCVANLRIIIHCRSEVCHHLTRKDQVFWKTTHWLYLVWAEKRFWVHVSTFCTYG